MANPPSLAKETLGSPPAANSHDTSQLALVKEMMQSPPSTKSNYTPPSSLSKETLESPPSEKSDHIPPSSFIKETLQIPPASHAGYALPYSPTQETRPSPPSDKSTQTPTPPNIFNRFLTHLAAEVTTSHADVLFLSCCFISGLVDSTIYDAYGTFVSMQTGNTIFLGLGGATPHSTSKPYGWAKSFCSIICFCVGCFFFSCATRWLGGLRRSTLIASFLTQTFIIFTAAAVVQGGAVDGSLNTITDDINWWTMIPIALLSFQSAGQIVGSRTLNLSEIPTVVLTSMLHDISTDPKLLAGISQNVKRNRRVCAFFCILIGAIAGGFIAQGTSRMQVPLWIAGGVKLGVTLAWMVWPEQKKLPV
ncbi:MAG: hypothetical protein Q9164_003942 [Protoblastenia rupestris]